VIIPNYHFISLLFVNQNDNISFIHHFNNGNVGVKVLNLLFRSNASRIVLQNLKTGTCGNGEIFLGLIRRNAIDIWLHFWHTPILLLLAFCVRLFKLVDYVLIDNTIFGLDCISVLGWGQNIDFITIDWGTWSSDFHIDSSLV
jgi:hypothetical protein